ncbi:MAG TPA: outer membrane beta-barrel protein [Usitatibacter sp.]|nr:outer membrane beta-barrel protein [Usitatibacter sp.]
MGRKDAGAALALIVLAAAGAAHAQSALVRPMYEFPTAPPISGPASVQLGETPLFVTPYLGAAYGYDDNLFYSHSGEKSSSLYLVSPGVKLDARDPNKVVQVSYQGQVGRYTSSSDDDYVDHTARAQFDAAFDRRNFLRLGFDYIRSHDPRGSTDRPLSTRPDRYRQSDPYVTYAFGTPGAPGRVELYYNGLQRRYLNNREFTASSDRDMPEFGGAFYWRAMPRTYVLVEARRTNIDYVDQNAASGDERRIYAGVSWEATAATTGTVKVGNLRRRFDEGNVPTFSGTSWEALVTWAPRSYSKFDLYSARQTSESTGLGSFILTSASGVAWNHAWSSFFSTNLNLRYQRDKYQDYDRTDRTTTLGVRAGYKFRRWLTLGAEFSRTQRDSNIDIFEYDKNLYLVTATFSL